MAVKKCFLNESKICDSRCKAFKGDILAMTKIEVRQYTAGIGVKKGTCKIIQGIDALGFLAELKIGEGPPGPVTGVLNE